MMTRSKRELFLFLSIIAVFFYHYVYVKFQLDSAEPSSALTKSTTNELELKHSNISTNDTNIDSTSIIKQNNNSNSNKKKNSCVSLSLDSDNNDEKEESERGIISLENLLRNDDGILQQVFIAMPAKAAGTSMNGFELSCMKHAGNAIEKHHGSVFKPGRNPKKTDFLYNKSSHKNTIISSHITNEDSFSNLIQNMPYSSKRTDRGSLLIYIHRGETDRLVSAIRQVMSRSVCSKKGLKNEWIEKFDPNKQQNKTHCIVNEDDVVELITDKRAEIGFGAAELLNCKTYETLKENNPLSYFDDDDDDESIVSDGGVLFMDYTQVDKLQKVLEKHHCPGMLSSLKSGSGAIHQNTADSKAKLQVLLRRRDDPNGDLVNLNDWLDEKRMILEWTLDLKGSSSCQTTTRRIEKKMYQCPDETMILPNSLL